MDIVLSYFIENYPWIAAIIVAVIITWMIAKYYHKVEDARKKVAKLPCEKLHEGIVVTK